MATRVGQSGAFWTEACFLHLFALKLISACFHIACNSLFYLSSCFQEQKSTLRLNLNLGIHFWLQQLNAGLIQSMCQVDTALYTLKINPQHGGHIFKFPNNGEKRTFKCVKQTPHY